MSNYARSRMKTRSAIGNIVGVYSKLYTSDVDKSNALNKFFSSVFTNEDPNTVSTFNVDKSDDVSSSSITINLSIVFEKLISLITGKAPGQDGWPAEIFNQCADHLCAPPSILFNKFLDSSIPPSYWNI